MLREPLPWDAWSGLPSAGTGWDSRLCLRTSCTTRTVERSGSDHPQGDFGIDIIIPAAVDPKKWDVYQIKKFARNLRPGQKAQIVESFSRVLIGMVRENVPLNDWYLVLPLDPTLDDFVDWLKEVPDKAIDKLIKDKKLDPKLTEEELEKMRAWLDAPDRIIGWKGLPFCESLVADYPYVADYYLHHGGRARLREAVSDVARLLGQDTKVRALEHDAAPGEGKAALLEPAEITEHLTRLDRVLDTDPHYRYDYGIDSHWPGFTVEPGLVAMTQQEIRHGRWLTFKIFYCSRGLHSRSKNDRSHSS